MKKTAAYILISVLLIFLLAGCGKAGESGEVTTEPQTQGQTAAGDGFEIVITEGHRYFMGEDTNVKETSATYFLHKGDKVDLGGVSELVIKVEDITDDTVTFTTNVEMSDGSAAGVGEEFSVTKGAPALKLNDMCLDDVASWYIFDIPGGKSETENPGEESAEGVYSITVTKGKEMIASCPEEAAAGDTVRIETMSVTDAVLKILVNGEELGEFIEECVYEFTMPGENVEITVRIDTSGFDV